MPASMRCAAMLFVQRCDRKRRRRHIQFGPTILLDARSGKLWTYSIGYLASGSGTCEQCMSASCRGEKQRHEMACLILNKFLMME
jgi:hypothetical protein